MVFGSGRLFDNNEGPNVKLSFDGFRAIAEGAHARLDLFALKPVTDAQGYFDDIPNPHQRVWGNLYVHLERLPRATRRGRLVAGW